MTRFSLVHCCRAGRSGAGAQPRWRGHQCGGVRQVSHTLRHYRHCQSDCGPRLVDRVRHEFQACLLPLLRLGILKDPAVLLHACAYLLLPLVAIGYGYVITNVAQLSLGTTAFVAGSLVLPGALVGAVCAPLGGWFYDKFGAVKPILIPLGIAILGPVLMLVFSMQLTPVLLAGFYFIFGLFYSIGNANVMTSGLSEVSPEFKPDGNAIFNTCLQFGGAAGTALFSTILSVAQAGAGEEGTAEFAHATAVGGTWTFATMTVICLIGWCCLATAFRIRAARKRA